MEEKNEQILKKEFTDGMPGHVSNAKYFYFNHAEKQHRNLNILCGGYEQCASDFNIDRKDFPFYAMIFTISGKGLFFINHKKFPLTYGSLLAFPPHTPYQLIADTESPMEQYFLIFSGKDADKLLRTSNITHKEVVKVFNPQAILSNFKQILRIGLNHTEHAQEICCNYLRAIILEQSDENYTTFTGSDSYENFLRCKNYLENNFITIQSSSQLAEACALNIRYIARLFRKYLNIRPYEYLINLKMNKAANLLITTNFNIKQIALMTGIQDPYHFSRIFKKRFQVSPTEYRECLNDMK
jgi:AraC-like DNA-binding protein